MGTSRALNIEDLRRIARRRLPRVVFDYVEGGAEDGVALRENRSIFESIHFAPRTLVDTSRRTQHISLFERIYESPLGVAPMAAAGLLWRDGDIALARAARAANVPFVLSMQGLVPLPRLVREVGTPPWFQLYMPRERSAAQAVVRRVLDSGCDVCVLTADVPVNGNREYNERNGFGRPLHLAPGKALDGLLHPRWLFGVYARRLWRARGCPADNRRDHMSWDDVAWLRDQWPRKLLVKGILGPEDAELAAACGVDGIVVSNHGGRQLDGVPAPLEVLPQIAAAVGDKLVVGIDSGFRRGSDIVKALALGAKIVFVGRAAAYGLAAGGEEGARRALKLLASEVDRVLALLGCPSAQTLGPQFLRGERLERALPRPSPATRLRVA